MALAEDLGSIPAPTGWLTTLPLQFYSFSYLHRHWACIRCTYVHAGKNISTGKNKINLEKLFFQCTTNFSVFLNILFCLKIEGRPYFKVFAVRGPSRRFHLARGIRPCLSPSSQTSNFSPLCPLSPFLPVFSSSQICFFQFWGLSPRS